MGAKTMSRLARQFGQVRLQVAGIGGEILVRRELGGIDEDADHHTVAHRLRASVTSDRWPSCSAPMVGTMPMRAGFAARASAARNSATVVTMLRSLARLKAAKQVWPRWVRRLQTSRASCSANRPKRAR